MTTTTSYLYEMCGVLFARYPLASETFTEEDTQRQMVLMDVVLMDASGNEPRFFCLIHVGDGRPLPFFSLHPWNSDGGVAISEDGTVEEYGGLSPAEAAEIAATAVPLPRDGSLFGWVNGEGVITALIAAYTGGQSEQDPVPGWSLMPHASVPEAEWPPFMGERTLGRWFWDHHQAGRLVSLAGFISGTRRTVYWVPTARTQGAGCVGVARDTNIPGTGVLLGGLYVYYQDLPLDSLPSLDDLHAGATDLGPRFREEG